MSINQIRAGLNGKLELYRAAQASVKTEREHVQVAKDQLETLMDAQLILQQVAVTLEQKAHSRIAAIVSKCLSMVFDDPYEFRILFERRRGKTEARMVFIRDGHELDPRKAAGGAVVDIAAFALRLAVLSLRNPKLRPIMVMDEPFRQMHESIRPRIVAMLEALSKEMGFQFIFATNENQLRAGKVIEIQ